MTARRIVLVRHGQTGHNLVDRFQGHLDVSLNEIGRARAARTAELLAGVLRDEHPVRLLSSDLSRATGSAAPLAELLGIPVATDPRLREIDVGAWQGLTRAEIATRWPDDFAAWQRGEDVPVGGGESRRQAGLRTAEAVRQLATEQDGGTLVVVSHGGVLRGVIFVLLGLTAAPDVAVPWAALAGLANSHWAELTRLGDGGEQGDIWRLAAYNVGALPVDTAADGSPIWSAPSRSR